MESDNQKKRRGRPTGATGLKTKRSKAGTTKYDGKSDEEKKALKNVEAGEAVQIFKQKKNIQRFLQRIAVGQSKISAFREIFPESESWSTTKIWRHVNCILMRNASSEYLKLYRNKWLEMLEQKKVDMLLYLEQEIIFNESKSIRAFERLKAIETFAKLAGFMAPTPTLVQNISVKEDTRKELLSIFGIESGPIENALPESNVIDAEIIDNMDDENE